ncbi:hypothetical protein [Streptomyces sp. NPDC051001]|uniref:hypothetical protein n=1 Tax=Streptomyces sp. NPDC051001 TaxID=3155795 RepID=UPI00343BF10C
MDLGEVEEHPLFFGRALHLAVGQLRPEVLGQVLVDVLDDAAVNPLVRPGLDDHAEAAVLGLRLVEQVGRSQAERGQEVLKRTFLVAVDEDLLVGADADGHRVGCVSVVA